MGGRLLKSLKFLYCSRCLYYTKNCAWFNNLNSANKLFLINRKKEKTPYPAFSNRNAITTSPDLEVIKGRSLSVLVRKLYVESCPTCYNMWGRGKSCSIALLPPAPIILMVPPIGWAQSEVSGKGGSRSLQVNCPSTEQPGHWKKDPDSKQKTVMTWGFLFLLERSQWGGAKWNWAVNSFNKCSINIYIVLFMCCRWLATKVNKQTKIPASCTFLSSRERQTVSSQYNK